MEQKTKVLKSIKLSKPSKSAFTLIELLVVIAIVGILSGFVFIQLTKAVDQANDARRKVDVASIEKAILMYTTQSNGVLPSTDTSGSACNICNGCANACAGLYDNIKAYLPNIPTEGILSQMEQRKVFSLSK